MSAPIRVLLAEDNEDLSAAIVALLEFQSDIQCVGTAATIAAVQSVGAATQASVVVLDIELDGESALRHLPALRAALPAAAFVMFSGHNHPEMIRSARAAGAASYVVKSEGLDALLEAVRSAARIHSG